LEHYIVTISIKSSMIILVYVTGTVICSV